MLKYLLKYKDSTGEADEIFYPTREAVEKEIIAQMEEVRSSLFSGCDPRVSDITTYGADMWDSAGDAYAEWRIDIYTEGTRRISNDDPLIPENPDVCSDGIVSFYLPSLFGMEEVFGVKPSGDGGWLNAYAFVDVTAKRILPYLEIVVVNGDNTEDNYFYALDQNELDLLKKAGLDPEQVVKEFSDEIPGIWYIGYPGGCEYVSGVDDRDIRIDELVKKGYDVDDIHVFPAEHEMN